MKNGNTFLWLMALWCALAGMPWLAVFFAFCALI
jgi:hypothetical protein